MAYSILILLLVLSLWLFIYEKIRFNRQSEEISYISLQLESCLQEGSRNYIRLASLNKATIQLAVSVNHVLTCFYNNQNETKAFRKNMQQVLTDISHDLKTPLTVVNGYAEILMQKTQTSDLPAEITHLILTLHEKTRSIVRQINQFFSLAKIQSGDMILHIQKTDVGRLCREILLEYYNILEEQDFTVQFPETKTPIYANSDEDAIRRILKNLIDNAVKYGSDGRFLCVSLEDGGQTLSISVTDHGKGICSEDQELVFSRNYHKGKIYGKNTSGSGLGLSISRKLAEQMNGTLTVSHCPCGGAVFTLTLPKS